MKCSSINDHPDIIVNSDIAIKMKDLASIAMSHWGVSKSNPKLLKFRENTIFKVLLQNMTPAVMRIHRNGYHSNLAIESEQSWMSSLLESGIKVPRIIPTCDGKNIKEIQDYYTKGIWQIDLLEWIEGEPLGSLEGPGIASALDKPIWVYEELGRITANLHNHSSNWSIPKSFNRHSWDIEGLVGDKPLWGNFCNLSSLTIYERKLLLSAKSYAKKELSSYKPNSTNYGLIHADLIPENIMFDGHTLRLIDFDDCGFGWHLFDLSTITFFFLGNSRFNCIKDAVWRGYEKERKLPCKAHELSQLFDLLRGFTYLGWVQTRADSESAAEITTEVKRITCNIAAKYLEKY